jgi:oligopeptide transport system substrate-binding protein
MGNESLKKGAVCFIAVCSLAIAGSLTSQKTQAAELAKDQTYNVVSGAEAGSIDLSLASDTYSFNILYNTYEGLYRLDKDNQPEIAGAAEAATVSSDGLTYTIKLRQDAKWSNGDPVTAADYVYSWQRTLDPKTASEYAYMFSPVKNADQINSGKVDKSQLGVKAVDDYTLQVTLEQVTPYFTSLLAFPTFAPQDQKVVEQYGDDYAKTSEKEVYNGPFKLADFSGAGTDTEYKLVKNDTYWDQANVKLQTINFSVVKESSTAMNLFKDGEADEIGLSGEAALQNKDNKAWVAEPSAMTQYLELNQTKKNSPFRNKNLRKAISYAINRQQMVDKILGDGSYVSNDIVPQKMSYNPTTKVDFTKDTSMKLKYSAAQAKKYWKKAKKELGIKKLDVSLLASDTESSKKMCEYLQGALQDTLSGVKVSVSNVPLSVRLDRSNKGKFDIVMNNWIADFGDPINFLDLFTSDSSYNRGNWSNTTYDKLVAKSSSEDAADPTARWTDMVKADQLLSKELGVIPLYQSSGAGLRNTKVKNVYAHVAGAGTDYKWAYIAK